MKNRASYFERLNSGMLVATFFSLWLAVYFENTIEDTLGYILILSFGILHGANDIKLLQVSAEKGKKRFNYLQILIYYVLFVLGVAGLFYLMPALALLFFIIFSAYHFGEQHWVDKISAHQFREALFFTSYGMLVLMILFLAHQSEVTSIVEQISGVALKPNHFLVITIVAGVLFVLLCVDNIKQIKKEIVLEIFYLLVFFIVFNTASLLWSFAIYFIIWHSIPSLSDQISYLYGDFSKRHLMKYLKSSAIYWLVAVISLILLFVFIEDTSAGFLPFLFSFIAAITFPHVFVIRRLNKG